MSSDAMIWAQDLLADLTPLESSLLQWLAWRHKHKPISYSLRFMGAALGVRHQSIRHAIDSMEALGLITYLPRGRRGQGELVLNLDATVAVSAPASGAVSAPDRPVIGAVSAPVEKEGCPVTGAVSAPDSPVTGAVSAPDCCGERTKIKKDKKKKNARARAREDETEHQPDPTPASPMNGAGVVSGMTNEEYDQALRMFLSKGRSKGW